MSPPGVLTSRSTLWIDHLPSLRSTLSIPRTLPPQRPPHLFTLLLNLDLPFSLPPIVPVLPIQPHHHPRSPTPNLPNPTPPCLLHIRTPLHRYNRLPVQQPYNALPAASPPLTSSNKATPRLPRPKLQPTPPISPAPPLSHPTPAHSNRATSSPRSTPPHRRPRTPILRPGSTPSRLLPPTLPTPVRLPRLLRRSSYAVGVLRRFRLA